MCVAQTTENQENRRVSVKDLKDQELINQYLGKEEEKIKSSSTVEELRLILKANGSNLTWLKRKNRIHAYITDIKLILRQI